MLFAPWMKLERDRIEIIFCGTVQSFVPISEVTELIRKIDKLTSKRYPLSFSEAALPGTSHDVEVFHELVRQCAADSVLKAYK